MNNPNIRPLATTGDVLGAPATMPQHGAGLVVEACFLAGGGRVFKRFNCAPNVTMDDIAYAKLTCAQFPQKTAHGILVGIRLVTA